MTIQTAPAAGFADPVQQSQQAFRALLDAMARPGRIAAVAEDIGHPEGMAPALAAAVLTLADLDTPLWLGHGVDTPAIREWLRFHTGAPLAVRPLDAAFVLLDAADIPDLGAFALGTDEAPETGATLLIQVPSLAGPAAMVWRGPGIRTAVQMSPCGLTEGFWRQRAALDGTFPRGLDIFLCCGDRLVGLPRSTAVAFGEA